MCEIRPTLPRVRRDEGGYTIPEILTALAILGVLLVIAVIVFLVLLERWRVEAAAEQLAADMRLAHGKATNRLTDWRVVLAPKDAGEDSSEGSGPDYYLVELKGVYQPGYPKPEAAKSVSCTFPADVKIKDHRSGTSNDAQGETRWVSPIPSGAPGPAPEPTRTVEFNSDGTMAFFEGPANSACVTVDGNPMLRVTASFPATSAIEIVDGSGFPLPRHGHRPALPLRGRSAEAGIRGRHAHLSGAGPGPVAYRRVPPRTRQSCGRRARSEAERKRHGRPKAELRRCGSPRILATTGRDPERGDDG